MSLFIRILELTKVHRHKRKWQAPWGTQLASLLVRIFISVYFSWTRFKKTVRFSAGFMLSKFSRLFILLLATSALGFTLIFVPWTRSTWAEDTVYTTIGVALAIVLTGWFTNLFLTPILTFLSSRRECHLLGLLGPEIGSLYASTSLLPEHGTSYWTIPDITHI